MNTTQKIMIGAARAFFASTYADQADECGQPLCGEIMDQLPETIDPAADHAARVLMIDMHHANNAIPAELYQRYPGGLTPEEWGHYAAMSAMGHGVGLWEYIDDAVNVPEIEFYQLEKDYFEDRSGEQ